MAKEKKQAREKTDYIDRAKKFLTDVLEESKKVVWPSWPTLWQSSLTVLASLVALTLIMGVFDLVWGWIFDKII